MKYILTVLLSVLSFNAFSAENDNFTAMTIHSEASREIKPDVFALNLSFSFKKDNKADAQKALNAEVDRALADIKKLDVKYEISDFSVRSQHDYLTKISSDVVFNTDNKASLESFEFAKGNKIRKSGKSYELEIEVSEVSKNKGTAQKLLERKIREIKNSAYNKKLAVTVHKSIQESVKDEVFIANQSIRIETKDAKKLKEVSKKFAGFVSTADSYVSEELKQHQKKELFKQAYNKAIDEIEFVKQTMGMKKYQITRVSQSNRMPQPYRNNLKFNAVMAAERSNVGISLNQTEEKIILNLNLDVKFYKK